MTPSNASSAPSPAVVAAQVFARDPQAHRAWWPRAIELMAEGLGREDVSVRLGVPSADVRALMDRLSRHGLLLRLYRPDLVGARRADPALRVVR